MALSISGEKFREVLAEIWASTFAQVLGETQGRAIQRVRFSCGVCLAADLLQQEGPQGPRGRALPLWDALPRRRAVRSDGETRWARRSVHRRRH